MLEVRGLSKQIGPHHILEDINFTVQKGQVKVLIGPSGSGKSTLLRCIDSLETPTRGQVFLDSELIGLLNINGRLVSPSQRKLQAFRRQMGIVFQKFNLWPHKTVLQNIVEGPIVVMKVERKKAVEEAMALLEKIRLPHKANVYPSTLSGGEQQRVAIARALAMHPKLLLLDEVTSALDPELVAEVLDTLQSLAAEGMTMVVVTHEMRFARDVADEIMFLDHSNIVEVGPPDQLLLHPSEPETRRFLASLQAGQQ